MLVSTQRPHTHTNIHYNKSWQEQRTRTKQSSFTVQTKSNISGSTDQTDVDLTANYLTAMISLRGRALCTMQASALWPQTANRTNKHFTLSCYAQYIYTHFHWSIPLAVIAINWSVHRFLGLLSDQLLSQSQTLLPAAPQQKLQDDS